MKENWFARLPRRRGDVPVAEASSRLKAARSVLLVKPHHKIGDLLVVTPVIRNLRNALPKTTLVFLAGRYNAPGVLDNPDLDEVVVVRTRGPLALVQAPAALFRLRRRRFDVALVLSTISQSATAVAFARWSGAGIVVGLDDAPYGNLAATAYDAVVPAPSEESFHMVDYNLALLEGLGIPATHREHVIGVTAAQAEEGKRALAAQGLDLEKPILGVQVGGAPTRSQRQWPPSHYASVAQRARNDLGWQVVLLGHSEDRSAVDAVQGHGRSKFPELVGLPFPTYKGMLRNLTFFLTHDGGPAHIAAGVGVPCYIVFLATRPAQWAPYGSHVHVWEDITKAPSPMNVWERLKPLLEVRMESGVRA